MWYRYDQRVEEDVPDEVLAELLVLMTASRARYWWNTEHVPLRGWTPRDVWKLGEHARVLRYIRSVSRERER